MDEVEEMREEVVEEVDEEEVEVMGCLKWR